MSETLVLEQIFFPIGMLIIYGISGYYNNTLREIEAERAEPDSIGSRDPGSLGIYLLALINDPMSMRRHIYLLILILALLLFGCTYAARYALTSRTISMLKETETNLLHADNRKLAKIAQDIQYNQEKRLGMGS